MSNNSIKVFTKRDYSSDMVWAINTDEYRKERHEVWFGRITQKLSLSTISKGDRETMIKNMNDKGFHEDEYLTIDRDSQMVKSNESNIPDIQFGHSTIDPLVTTLIYQLSEHLPRSIVRDYLSITVSNLDDTLSEELKSLDTYKNIEAGLPVGICNLSEGTLAVFLLFGLRKYVIEYLETDVDLVKLTDGVRMMPSDLLSGLSLYVDLAFKLRLKEQESLKRNPCGDQYLDERLEMARLDINQRSIIDCSENSQIAIAFGCVQKVDEFEWLDHEFGGNYAML